MSAEIVTGDTAAAIDFLAHWAPKGFRVLLCDDVPTLTTTTFAPGEEVRMAKWIDERQGRFNIYFSPNQPRTRVRKKTDKLDMGAIVTLHLDLDPHKGGDLQQERARILKDIEAFPIRPTVVTDSGGGFWAFWLLAEPQEIAAPCDGARRAKDKAKKPNGPKPTAEEAADLGAYLKPIEATEAYSKELARRLGGDACFNVDRIARLPGTVNVPSEKKQREKGQRPALARVVWAEWDRRYSLDDFPKPAPAQEKPESLPGSPSIGIERREPADWCKAVIKEPLCKPDGKHDYKGHRARAAYAICCELVRCRWSDAEIDAELRDEANGISEHVLKQKPPERYIAKSIAQAREVVESDFVKDDGMIIANSQHNVRLALAKLDVHVTFDAFAGRMLIEGPEGKERRHLGDAESESTYLLIDELFRFRPKMEFYTLMLRNEARRNTFHPVRDYLDDLKWDGTPRVDGWLIKYGRAKDTPYTRAVGKIFLVAAVRRVRQPGCKFDEMLVLESDQGLDKSGALAKLAVRDEWFSDDLPLNTTTQKAMEAMQGKWIVEAGELQGLRKGDVEHLKAFLSRRHDRARMSYDRFATEGARQCVFAGTTNSNKYLRDVTGNRRFWPVACKRFDLVVLGKDVDQLWAEAAHIEAAGESIRLNPALYPVAAEEQEARRDEDPWEPLLAAALGLVKGWISSDEVWRIIGLEKDKRQPVHNTRLSDTMRKLGWRHDRRSFDGLRLYGYTNCDNDGQRLWIRFDDGGKPYATPDEPARNRHNGATDDAARAAERGPSAHFESRRPPLPGDSDL